MTYSEMREAYLLSSQLGKDVFIGGWNGPWYIDSNELTMADNSLDSVMAYRFDTCADAAAIRRRS
jgi:hypothetical protein